MKKFLLILLYGTTALLLGACNDSTIIETDLDNDFYTFEELLEMADYITIVKVDGIDHTDLNAESVGDSSNIQIPRTYFNITPVYDIKGTLSNNELVGIMGGYNEKDQFVEYTLDKIIIPGDYNLFEVGSHYIMVLHDDSEFSHLSVHPFSKLAGYDTNKPPHEQHSTILNELMRYGLDGDEA